MMSNALEIDHKEFFNLYRSTYGRLTQLQVDGIDGLLTNIAQDPHISELRWAAYMLATVKHECADRWQPIEEYGLGRGRPYGRAVKVLDDDGNPHFQAYYGRGYVQLTWQQNYETMSIALGLGRELVTNPDRALNHTIAYRIMSHGMRKGIFTGHSLGDHIHGDVCDYKNARRIINGLDRCDLIERYAQDLETMLRRSIP